MSSYYLRTFFGPYLRRNSPTFTHNLGTILYSSFTTLSAASSNYAAFEKGRKFFFSLLLMMMMVMEGGDADGDASIIDAVHPGDCTYWVTKQTVL